jgi:hypothetical protein
VSRHPKEAWESKAEPEPGWQHGSFMISCALVGSPQNVQVIFADNDRMKVYQFAVVGMLAK